MFILCFGSNKNAFYLYAVTIVPCSSTPYYVHAWLYKGCGYCTDLSVPCNMLVYWLHMQVNYKRWAKYVGIFSLPVWKTSKGIIIPYPQVIEVILNLTIPPLERTQGDVKFLGSVWCTRKLLIYFTKTINMFNSVEPISIMAEERVWMILMKKLDSHSFSRISKPETD